MRQLKEQQPGLTPVSIAHEHAHELDVMSDILDENPEILELVYRDLVAEVSSETGRRGMTAEQTLRALIVKQMNGFSYVELAFHLADSRTYSAFCRLPWLDEKPVSGSALWEAIHRIRPGTLEAINRVLVGVAKDEGVEKGRKVRIDCTVTETNIHAPTDSSLLWDVVRVLTRTMRQATEVFGDALDAKFTDHTRRAKRRNLGIHNASNAKMRLPLYRDLLKVTRKTLGYAASMADALAKRPTSVASLGFEYELRHILGLGRRVVDQTQRRVINGEKVPASEKLVSIFEPDTDIIIKSRRETEFGHKLCLTTGASSLVTDCVIEDGNPPDSKLAVGMVERQKEIYGRVPRQTAFDGGFASKKNLAAIKGMGVKDVAFHKKRGLAIADMAKSTWVYKRLRRFRAGVEGVISFLKRCFGLTRCTWTGIMGFKSYVWGSIVSANLLILARHRLA